MKKLNNIYEKLVGTSDYVKNSKALNIASLAVTTLSAIATAYVNAMVHKESIGYWAWGLALLIFCVAEGTLLISNHGLLNVYTNAQQRFWATIAYWLLKCAIWLNIAILGCWLHQFPLPLWLDFWNRWSLALHTGIALILIDLIRNKDSSKQHKMAELRAQTAEIDALTARMLKSYTSGVLFASAMRGMLDGWKAALKIFRTESEFPDLTANNQKRILTEHLQNIGGKRQNALQNSVQNVLQNTGQIVRLGGPPQVKAPYRTTGSVPVSKKNPQVAPASRTNLEGLPQSDSIRWVPNKRGGFEAWYVPYNRAPRDARVYLGYVNQDVLKDWKKQNNLKKEVEQWIHQQIEEKKKEGEI